MGGGGNELGPMGARLEAAREFMVAEPKPLHPTWAERGANGTIAQREKERARQYRLEIYGEEIGAAYNDLADPISEEESHEDWEVVAERRKEVMAQALQKAIEGDDPMKRLQGFRAIVDLAMEEQPHRHPEFRMR